MNFLLLAARFFVIPVLYHGILLRRMCNPIVPLFKNWNFVLPWAFNNFLLYCNWKWPDLPSSSWLWYLSLFVPSFSQNLPYVNSSKLSRKNILCLVFKLFFIFYFFIADFWNVLVCLLIVFSRNCCVTFLSLPIQIWRMSKLRVRLRCWPTLLLM